MNIFKKVIVLLLSHFCDLLFILELKHNWLRILQLKLMNFKYGREIRLGHSVYFRSFGNMEFGNNCNIGTFSKFWNYSKIIIGDNFAGAGNLVINTASHQLNDMVNFSNEVVIGKNVWCGVNVTILGGVKIGDNVVIGACSLVNRDLPDNCVAYGVPAKPVRFIDRASDFAYLPFKK